MKKESVEVVSPSSEVEAETELGNEEQNSAISAGRITKYNSLKADLSRASGVELIRVERDRQIEVEGWSHDHDLEHERGQLSIAAAWYAVEGTDASISYPDDEPEGSGWPWGPQWCKPKDRVRNLTRAGALIAAEIDREIETLAQSGGMWCPLCQWSGTEYRTAGMSGPVCPQCDRKGVLQHVSPIAQDAATASALSQDVPDKSSVLHQTESVPSSDQKCVKCRHRQGGSYFTGPCANVGCGCHCVFPSSDGCVVSRNEVE